MTPVLSSKPADRSASKMRRLTPRFILLIAFAVIALSIIMVRDLQRAQSESRRMHGELVRGFSMVSDLQYHAQETRRSMLYALTTINSDLQVQYADQSIQLDPVIQAILQQQIKAAHTPRESRTLLRLQENWNGYLLSRNRVIASILEGDTKAALDIDMTECVDAFNRVRTDLEDVKLLLDAQAKQELKESERIFQRSLWKLGFILTTVLCLAASAGQSMQTRRMLTRVQRSENRLREVIGSISEGMFVIGDDQRIELWNQTAESLTGLAAAEVSGRKFAEVFPQETSGALEKALADSRKELAAFELCEVNWTVGERELVLAFRGFPFEKGLTVFFSDVTAKRRSEREMAELNRKLIESSRFCGMAEVATGVLHNVGNVLNSVNVSSNLIAKQVHESRLVSLGRAIDMMRTHSEHLAEFLTNDPKGKQLPKFIEAVTEHLIHEQKMISNEIKSLQQNIDHIKQIVVMQQSYAKASGAIEPVDVEELIEQSLRMSSTSLSRHQVEVVREYSAVPRVMVDQHKVLQILVNLVSNAKEAMVQVTERRALVLRTGLNPAGAVCIHVTDNGMGISRENLTRIFRHGFTTKRTGHGFGLHSAANAAKEMGGTLSVDSPGVGLGATFTLELPAHQSATASSDQSQGDSSLPSDANKAA